MHDDVFVDGVLGAGFSNGAVRIVLHSLVHDPQVRKEPTVRLIMTSEGFLDVYARLTEVMEKLKSTGQLTTSGPAGDIASGQEKISPNF